MRALLVYDQRMRANGGRLPSASARLGAEWADVHAP
ncbi:hypothetical protein XHC_3796 [Xanthomonas hortorum pv. carotae str. M081]|nr:hypothetical protein XHC_3796 [Xanthomonas hortorum pv. carotae str. M081]